MSTTQHNATRDIPPTSASLRGLSSHLDGLDRTLQVAFAMLRRWLHPTSLGPSRCNLLSVVGGGAAAPAAGTGAAAATGATGAAAATGAGFTRSGAQAGCESYLATEGQSNRQQQYQTCSPAAVRELAVRLIQQQQQTGRRPDGGVTVS